MASTCLTSTRRRVAAVVGLAGGVALLAMVGCSGTKGEQSDSGGSRSLQTLEGRGPSVDDCEEYTWQEMVYDLKLEAAAINRSRDTDDQDVNYRDIEATAQDQVEVYERFCDGSTVTVSDPCYYYDCTLEMMALTETFYGTDGVEPPELGYLPNCYREFFDLLDRECDYAPDPSDR